LFFAPLGASGIDGSIASHELGREVARAVVHQHGQRIYLPIGLARRSPVAVTSMRDRSCQVPGALRSAAGFMGVEVVQPASSALGAGLTRTHFIRIGAEPRGLLRGRRLEAELAQQARRPVVARLQHGGMGLTA
jgi:hypothetical protein